MELFIGIILGIMVLMILGLILRKRVYDHVDRLEAWKLDIMSRNVNDELSQIKNLNLSGETQEKFEAWKERWDHIVGREVADIEEQLLTAESAADRFLMPKGKKILKQVETKLKAIETSIEGILSELNELLESERMSSEEAEAIEPAIKDLRRQISQNRYQYPIIDRHFEELLDELDADLKAFHETIDEGNYMVAKESILKLKEEVTRMEEEIAAFPVLHKKAKHELPSQLDQLLSGMKEMREADYFIEHLPFEKETRTYQQRITDIADLLVKGELAEGGKLLQEMDERVSEMYDLLEQEAVAKGFLEQQIPTYEESVIALYNAFATTKAEVEELREAYYVADEEMERFLSVDKRSQLLKDELAQLVEQHEMNNEAHSELRARVEAGFKQIDELKEKHEQFKEMIQTLRKDELYAKDKFQEMRRTIQDLARRLKKSNIPGVPTFIVTSLEEAEQKNDKVLHALNEHPLDTGAVHRALEEAETAINRTTEQIEVLLDQAYLTEHVIQYANRYRSKNPTLAAELEEAERLFRSYEYDLALEKAAKAIEEVEPGALQRIEDSQMAINE